MIKRILETKNRPRFPPARTPGLSCKQGSPRGGGPGGARDTACPEPTAAVPAAACHLQNAGDNNVGTHQPGEKTQ